MNVAIAPICDAEGIFLWDAEVNEDSPYDPTNAVIRLDG